MNESTSGGIALYPLGIRVNYYICFNRFRSTLVASKQDARAIRYADPNPEHWVFVMVVPSGKHAATFPPSIRYTIDP